jgi:hypothetical protein
MRNKCSSEPLNCPQTCNEKLTSPDQSTHLGEDTMVLATDFGVVCYVASFANNWLIYWAIFVSVFSTFITACLVQFDCETCLLCWFCLDIHGYSESECVLDAGGGAHSHLVGFLWSFVRMKDLRLVPFPSVTVGEREKEQWALGVDMEHKAWSWNSCPIHGLRSFCDLTTFPYLGAVLLTAWVLVLCSPDSWTQSSAPSCPEELGDERVPARAAGEPWDYVAIVTLRMSIVSQPHDRGSWSKLIRPIGLGAQLLCGDRAKCWHLMEWEYVCAQVCPCIRNTGHMLEWVENETRDKVTQGEL